MADRAPLAILLFTSNHDTRHHNQPESSRIIHNQPESFRINHNQPESSIINPNQPKSPRINLSQPISALQHTQIPACYMSDTLYVGSNHIFHNPIQSCWFCVWVYLHSLAYVKIHFHFHFFIPELFTEISSLWSFTFLERTY